MTSFSSNSLPKVQCIFKKKTSPTKRMYVYHFHMNIILNPTHSLTITSRKESTETKKVAENIKSFHISWLLNCIRIAYEYGIWFLTQPTIIL